MAPKLNARTQQGSNFRKRSMTAIETHLNLPSFVISGFFRTDPDHGKCTDSQD